MLDCRIAYSKYIEKTNIVYNTKLAYFVFESYLDDEIVLDAYKCSGTEKFNFSFKNFNDKNQNMIEYMYQLELVRR